MNYSPSSGEVQPLNIKTLNIDCLLNGINYCPPNQSLFKLMAAVTIYQKKASQNHPQIWDLCIGPLQLPMATENIYQEKCHQTVTKFGTCVLDPYSYISDGKVNIYQKKRHQSTPKFGTCMYDPYTSTHTITRGPPKSVTSLPLDLAPVCMTHIPVLNPLNGFSSG